MLLSIYLHEHLINEKCISVALVLLLQTTIEGTSNATQKDCDGQVEKLRRRTS